MFGKKTDPLIIDDGHFFDATESAELFIEITLLGTNAETKHTQDARGIGCLLGFVSIGRIDVG